MGRSKARVSIELRDRSAKSCKALLNGEVPLRKVGAALVSITGNVAVYVELEMIGSKRLRVSWPATLHFRDANTTRWWTKRVAEVFWELVMELAANSEKDSWWERFQEDLSRDSSSKDRKLLGLGAAVKEEEARKTYRDLVRKFHPDRPGGSHEKMAEVNAAWDRVCKAEGWH